MLILTGRLAGTNDELAYVTDRMSYLDTEAPVDADHSAGTTLGMISHTFAPICTSEGVVNSRHHCAQ